MIIGELSALGGSCCWATCSTLFTASVRRLGPYGLNLVRLFMALVLLAAALWIQSGSPLPAATTAANFLWLALSAVVGLVLGDLLYFGALDAIGPRLTLLLFTLSPPVAAAGELFVFGRGPGLFGLAGMAVVLAGVSAVITDRRSGRENGEFKVSPRGVLLGAGAAFCQGAGLVLSKMGLEGLDVLSGTFIRMAAAAPIFALFFFASGRSLGPILGERRGLALALGGAFFGPFLGVTLSLAAVKYTNAGVAMTILSTTPITILPYSLFLYKERLTPRTLSGTVLAVIGVAILFFL